MILSLKPAAEREERGALERGRPARGLAKRLTGMLVRFQPWALLFALLAYPVCLSACTVMRRL